MCQLLGMNANTPTDVCFSFTGLATRADEHKDGFGIAFFEDKGLRLFVDPHSARQSPVAELVKNYPIRSGNVIAHIRKATQGHVALENTHPFVRELAKAHAGVPTIAELSATLRELLPVLHAHGTFNMLLSNGKALWVHASTHLHWLQRRHPFCHATLADEDVSVDFANETTPDDRVVVVATEPLTTGEAWAAMAPGELQVFVDGASA
jgi:predicted glutamine amidotransferase